jgi:hypothetical protein
MTGGPAFLWMRKKKLQARLAAAIHRKASGEESYGSLTAISFGAELRRSQM